MEGVCAEGKGKGRMRCGKKEEREKEKMKKKEKEKKGKEEKEKKENGENDTRDAPPSLDAFPSAKLGNNITPINGRQLGKNTTLTSRSPTKLNQNLQKDPR